MRIFVVKMACNLILKARVNVIYCCFYSIVHSAMRCAIHTINQFSQYLFAHMSHTGVQLLAAFISRVLCVCVCVRG